MKCPYCKGRGIVVTGYGDIFKCRICHGTGNVEPLTKEEWFCALSTEEKAKWFCDHITCSDGCPFNKQCLNEDMGRKLWQKWLLEEHREMSTL
ncbi:MAG: hypothetical protein IKF90_00515 [Parasporobacterium sp.]|nr:hypothetical protein [Parasporobacterium sp.]